MTLKTGVMTAENSALYHRTKLCFKYIRIGNSLTFQMVQIFHNIPVLHNRLGKHKCLNSKHTLVLNLSLFMSLFFRDSMWRWREQKLCSSWWETPPFCGLMKAGAGIYCMLPTYTWMKCKESCSSKYLLCMFIGLLTSALRRVVTPGFPLPV